jgi:hypothetical protein
MSFFTYHIKPSSFGEIGAKPNIVITPSTVDTTSTTLHLPGQSKTNYGEFYNQNLVRMLEHFSNANPPELPTVGQIWYQPYLINNVTDAGILARAPLTPMCREYWDPSNATVLCNYVDQYCDVSYCSETYIGSLTCVPIIDQNVQNQLIMWDCTRQHWVERKYVERLRVYSGSVTNQDPNYPGWVLIQLKETTPPADPLCGDLFFNPNGSSFHNTLGDVLVADTLYYWDCVATPPQWTPVGQHTFVRLDGANTPMSGLLRLVSVATIDASGNGDTAVSKDWATRKAGDVMTGSLFLHNTTNSVIENAVDGTIAITKDWSELTFVNVTGDTMNGTLVMSSGAKVTGLPLPTALSDATNKEYVDYWVNAYDWQLTYSTRAIPYDQTVTPYVDDHPPIDKTGRKYWDTLYRRNGALEVNNIYWRNMTDDIKDRLKCALNQTFELAVGQIPADFYTQPYKFFKSWVQPRDIELFLTYGVQPIEITLTIDLIQTANYSTVTGPGGMLNVVQHINVNNALMLHLRQTLGDPTYTIHSEEFGGKFSIVDTSLSPITVDVKQRAQLPQINRITGYSLWWGIPSTTYPGTLLVLNAFDMDWMLTNLGPTYVGPPGFGGANDTRLSINPATNKTRDDVNQRWIWHIHVDDSTTGTLNQYVIQYFRPYSITNGWVDSITYIGVESGGTPPNYVHYMARVYANWQYNDYDLRALLARNGEAMIANYQPYCAECAGQPSTILTNSLGLFYLTSGTGPGAEAYINYLTFAGYTAGLSIGVTATNFNHITGDLDLMVAITNGSVGYSNFPSNLLVNKATVPITYKFFPAIGYNPGTGTFESIIDLPTVFANHCNW